jgi:glycosyltransferase involved in cell wall biosynthesis
MPDRSRLVVVAWNQFQPRTSALARALGGEARHIFGAWPGRSVALLPLRYLADSARMWLALRKARPDVLIVISPPIVAPMVAWLWTRFHPCLLAVDCHTGALNSHRWAWTVPIHRILFRRARVVLLHTEEDAARVRAWGVPALLVPDDLPDIGEATSLARSAPGPRVVLAGSLDANEPVAAELAAAALTPEIEVRVTGDMARVPAPIRSSAPTATVFTGYLPYPQFLGELLAADVVAVFSTDPHIMNRAAFEAIGLGRPLVLSDLPGLRTRFAEAARFCPNEPAAMAQAIREALRDREHLAERSWVLRHHLQAQRESALAWLRSMLELAAAPPRLAAEGQGSA